MQHSRRVIQLAAVELPELADAVADRLRMHEERRGDVVAPAVVQQPCAQRLDELIFGRRPKISQRGKNFGAQVIESIGVRPQHKIRQAVVGVDGRLGGQVQLDRPQHG